MIENDFDTFVIAKKSDSFNQWKIEKKTLHNLFLRR